MIDVVALDRVTAQPWRNGGGSTRELLAWPSAAHWAMRISVAEVNQDGPFSAFPGVERWFAVVQGAGVVLRFALRREALDKRSPPLRFDGEQAPDCVLNQGPTRDLNLMLRSSAGSGVMLAAKPDEEWLSPAPLRAVFCAEAAQLQINDNDAARLPAMSLAWSDSAAQARWALRGDGRAVQAWWMSFQPARSSQP